MAFMKLHWSPKSPFVRKVMIAAHELGIAGRVECIRSVAIRTRPNPVLMADNPLNKIPTLVLDDGATIFDSRVIIEYFDELCGGGRLIPPHGRERWIALRDQALADGLLDLLLVWRGERERPQAQQSSDHVSACVQKVAATLDRLELASDSLVRAPFGVAHIAIGCALAYADFRFADLQWRQSRPRLTAWFSEFVRRPSVQATAIFDDLAGQPTQEGIK